MSEIIHTYTEQNSCSTFVPLLFHRDSSRAEQKRFYESCDAVITSPPTDPEIFGALTPDIPRALFSLGSENGPKLFSTLRMSVRYLKVGGWFWVRSPWAEEPVIRRSLELLGLRYRTRLVHLFPPERKGVKHAKDDPDAMASLLVASSIWQGWQKERRRGSREDRVWLNGQAASRRPTTVFLEDASEVRGDYESLTNKTMSAFLAPKVSGEATLGLTSKAPVRGPTGIDIARYLVRLSTSPGDRVFDPFSGSGSVPIAAALEGRKSTGFEVQEAVHEVAKVRTDWWLSQPVLPLEITTWEQKLSGARGSMSSIQVQLPLTLKKALSDSGASFAATIRAALCVHYQIPLTACEHASSPGRFGPELWAGRTSKTDVAVPIVLEELLSREIQADVCIKNAVRKYLLTP